MLAAVVLLVFSVPVQASKVDDQIISSAKNSYVFKSYLKHSGKGPGHQIRQRCKRREARE
jgi:hypothetical protein